MTALNILILWFREYPLNPELKNPPIKRTTRDLSTGEQKEVEIYIPLYSTHTMRQMEADQQLAKILTVSFGILGIAGLIAVGFYIGRTHFSLV